jgi:hypothetical protein
MANTSITSERGGATRAEIGFHCASDRVVLGGLKAVLDGPAIPLDSDERLDWCSSRAPGGEVGYFAIGNVAADQQTPRPEALCSWTELISLEVRQFQIRPFVQALALCAQAGEQALPSGRIEGLGDVFRHG